MKSVFFCVEWSGLSGGVLCKKMCNPCHWYPWQHAENLQRWQQLAEQYPHTGTIKENLRSIAWILETICCLFGNYWQHRQIHNIDLAKQTAKILQTVSCEAADENNAKLKRNLRTETFGYMWTVQRKNIMFTSTVFCPPEVAGLVPGINFSSLALVQQMQLTAMLWIKMHHVSTGAVISKLPDLGRDAQHWASRVRQEVQKCRA